MHKKISYSPLTLIHGNYWHCEKCPDLEEFEYIQEGSLFSSKKNEKLEKALEIIYFHCYPCNAPLWNPGKDKYVCRHSKTKCSAEPPFTVKDGTINIMSKL